jgi:hypothetical protein
MGPQRQRVCGRKRWSTDLHLPHGYSWTAVEQSLCGYCTKHLFGRGSLRKRQYRLYLRRPCRRQLQTTAYCADGGKSWNDAVGPEAIDGEASFAASGSAIAVGNNSMSIVTGGTVSRLHVTMDLRDGHWAGCPRTIELAQGTSFARRLCPLLGSEKSLYIVGGDYMEEDNTYGTALVANLMTGPRRYCETMEKLASLAIYF